MNVTKKNKVARGPRPVRPTNICNHGLLGISNVRQHMIVDERWTPNSITEEFKGMTDLLTKRHTFKKLENVANRKHYTISFQALRRQCRDGRTKLQMALHGANTLQIRNCLINHKDMQRLYQNMPIQMVVDNINQCTFTMRKEKDRLQHRLDQLKATYKAKLLERANLENRIKYENEFVLEEEIKCREFRKKIENSHVRFKAIKRINATYQKLIQILRHDSIFYEPILRSLSSDIEDQTNFIKHLLFLGMPAIAKFKELGEEYRQMEDKSRKNLQGRLSFKGHMKKDSEINELRKGVQHSKSANTEVSPTAIIRKRYVRETRSMMFKKNELAAKSVEMKQIKFATLCSQPKEIFTRLKTQVENNRMLHKTIEETMLNRTHLEAKQKRSVVLEGVLVNNLDEEQIEQQNYIRALQERIALTGHEHSEILAHMNNRSNTYVVLRLFLWNLADILRCVDRPIRVRSLSYPTSYLKLPLLKFDMLTMRAVPPEGFEQNVDIILKKVRRKVAMLMKAYEKEIEPQALENNAKDYSSFFLEMNDVESLGGDLSHLVGDLKSQEVILDSKVNQSVPNRKQVKAQSAKVVEDHLKKDE